MHLSHEETISRGCFPNIETQGSQCLQRVQMNLRQLTSSDLGPGAHSRTHIDNRKSRYLLRMYKSLLIGFSILILPLFAIQAADYKFRSKLNFQYENTFIAGVLDQYKLPNNSGVRLLVGNLSNKNLKNELDRMSDTEIKLRFLSEAKNFDVFSRVERNLSDFAVARSPVEIRIFYKFTVKAQSGTTFELNSYVVRQSNSLAATLYYDERVAQNIQKEFYVGLKNIALVEGGKSTSLLEGWPSRPTYSFVKWIPLLIGAESQAATTCEKVNKKYIIRGEYTSKPGSALFNFEKMTEELKIAASINNEADLGCLTKSVNSAIENSSTYWAGRGIKENCLDAKGKLYSERPSQCSEATFTEMNRSLAYLDKVKGNLVQFVKDPSSQTKDVEKCAESPLQKNIKALHVAGREAKQDMCCDEGSADGKNKGPLFLTLEADSTDFKNLSTPEKTLACLRKTNGDATKKLASIDGAADCLTNIVSGLIKSLSDMIKALPSLFEWETVKFVANLVNVFNSDARAEAWTKIFTAVKTIGDELGAKIFSITDCFGPYEKEQYTCKMTGSAVSILLGPGSVKVFAKWLATGAKASGLSELIATASSKPPIKQALEISQKAKASAGATSKVAVATTTKISAELLEKLKLGLRADLGKPMKSIVEAAAAKIIKAKESAAMAASTAVNGATSTVKQITEKLQTSALASEVAELSSATTSKLEPVLLNSALTNEVSTVSAAASTGITDTLKITEQSSAATVTTQKVEATAITRTTAADTTNLSKNKVLSAAEGQQLVDKAKFFGSDQKFVNETVKKYGLQPNETVTVGKTKFSISDPFDIGDGRVAAIAVIENGGTTSTRLFYKSNSQGIFRLLPGTTSTGWFSKGVGEASLDAPSAVQRALSEKISSNAVRTNLPENFHKYVVPEYKTPYEAVAAAGNDPALAVTRQDILTPSKNIIESKATTHTPPKELKLANTSHAPAFASGKVTTYETTTSAAGKVTANVFKSVDGSLEYTFFEDKTGRAWIASIDSTKNPINEAGIRSTSVNTGDLTMPRYEYPEQIPTGFRGTGRFGPSNTYGDAWPYLRETPLIKAYYKSRGLPVPP